ncbi:V4R domain-containing protein [Nocardia africana]
MQEVSALIARALDDMCEYQEQFTRDPGHAQVSVAGVPHALVPTHVVASDLPRELEEILGAELAPAVMYRFGRLIGASHAAAFFSDRRIGMADAQYRVLTGPFHFAWAGYGDVQLLLWEPKLDEGFLILWESDNSFSAREALNDGRRSRVCHLQAGYAAGWSSEATGLPIDVHEIACRAEGVSYCRFVMGHRDRLSRWMRDPRLHRPTKEYKVVPANMIRAASA